jgi:hypothetical protein
MVTLSWGEGQQEAHCVGLAVAMSIGQRGTPDVVGSIGEDGEQPRARATLLVGSMGLEEHQGRRSTVARVQR